MSDPLPRIPVPWSRRWLAFRRSILPVAAFVICALLAARLWQTAVAPPTLLAEVESIQAEVRSVESGSLISLEVEMFQPVEAGAIVARMQPVAPEVLAASLAVIRAEIDYLRESLEPALTGKRLELEADRLHLEWLKERVTLATLKAQLIEAEAVYRRLERLRSQQVVSEQEYTTAKNTRDALAVQIKEQERLVATLEPAMQRSADSNTPSRSTDSALAAAIRVQEEKLRLTEARLGPVILRAPIDGIVSAIYRRSGENISAGEPILHIAEATPKRLVGYVRQPLAFEPRAGQPVEIRSRTMPRVVAHATIESVGAIMEPVPPTLLAALNRADVPELGLRVHIPLPPGLPLHPGECVDVIVEPTGE